MEEHTLAGEVPLAVRVARPAAACRGAAFIAHPYAFLGGTQDDPVVQQLAAVFRDFLVVTFDSRGAGASGGRTSWTFVPECRDYQAVVDWALGTFGVPRDATLVFCGYSCGALQASAARAPGWADVRYVLVSYPLDVVWLVTCFGGRHFRRCLAEAAERRVLLMYGTADQFTSAASYAAWARTLAQQHTVDAIAAPCDHFWRGALHTLAQAGAWARST